jgi:hypothetical protein
MTAEIINLRQFRKDKARLEKERQAARNRAQFGRTKAEKFLTGANKGLDETRLDGAAREDDTSTVDVSAGQRPIPGQKAHDQD